MGIGAKIKDLEKKVDSLHWFVNDIGRMVLELHTKFVGDENRRKQGPRKDHKHTVEQDSASWSVQNRGR